VLPHPVAPPSLPEEHDHPQATPVAPALTLTQLPVEVHPGTPAETFDALHLLLVMVEGPA
jgi:hypothetical protein